MKTLKIQELPEFKSANEETQVSILASFEEFQKKVKSFEKKALAIKVDSEDQVDEMKKAKELRVLVSKTRIEIEKRRKELKSESLKKGKAIDASAKVLLQLIEPSETHLRAQEEFVKRKEKEAAERLANQRRAKLDELEYNHDALDLVKMDQTTFDAILFGAKAAKEQKDIESKEKAKQDEIAANARKTHDDRLNKLMPYYDYLPEGVPGDLSKIYADEFLEILNKAKSNKLHHERKNQLLPFFEFIENESTDNLSMLSQKGFNILLKVAKNRKDKHDKEVAQLKEKEAQKAKELELLKKGEDQHKIEWLVNQINDIRDNMPEVTLEKNKKLLSNVDKLFNKILNYIDEKTSQNDI